MAHFNPVEFLRQAARNSPWLVIAVALHAVIIAVMSVIYLAGEREPPITFVGNVSISAKPPEPLPPPEVRVERLPPKPLEAEIVDPDRDFEYTPSNVPPDLSQEVGDPNSESSSAPTSSTAIGAGIRPGKIGGRPTPFQGQGTGEGPPPGRATTGPTQETEKAVREGLLWLIRHQGPDGSWDATALPACCVTDERCASATASFPAFWQQGLTGLAVLTFLGAGYNFDSRNTITDTVQAREFRIADVVRRGLDWIRKSQQPDGSFGPDQHVYNQALCSLALSESYGLSRNFMLRDPAQRAIDWLVRAQKTDPDGSGGAWGWRYHSNADVLALQQVFEARQAAVDAMKAPLDARKEALETARADLEARRGELESAAFAEALEAIRAELASVQRELEQLRPEQEAVADGLRRMALARHDSDLSVTTWVIMAFKSAEAAGLNVPRAALLGARSFALSTSTDDGRAGYLSRAGAGLSVSGRGDHFEYHTGTMSALSMLCRTFVDRDIDDPFLERAAQQLVKDLPEVSKDGLSIDYYYWYYASLALNQFDGPESPRRGGRYWDPWNRAMKSALISTQDDTQKACTRGGWVLPDRWSLDGGPIYATAINVLTLEVYYRYPNAFR